MARNAVLLHIGSTRITSDKTIHRPVQTALCTDTGIQARRKEGSRGSNEHPLKINRGGLKMKR